MREPEWLSWPVEQVVAAAKLGVKVVPDREAVFRDMAETMAAELRANNAAGQPTRWILPVGPTGPYPFLVDLINRERLDLSRLRTFQMDEYLDWTCRPIPPSHKLSFTGFFQREFFGRLDPTLRPAPEQHTAPDPRNLDALADAIAAAGGVDTCYGGIGIHGHVAFNEPPRLLYGELSVAEFAAAPTRIVPLAAETIVTGGMHGADGNFEIIPPFGVTIGMRDILAARRIRLYVHRGQSVRAVFRRALLQAPTVRYPVTLLQGHPDTMVVANAETAAPVERFTD